jgi:uncharacterized protein (TIGR00369 family)
MAELSLVLDADGVTALLRKAFPDAEPPFFPRVHDLSPGRIHMISPFREQMLRPGRLISGPVQMSLADNAAYALVLAHIGDQLMAVTSTMTANFLRGCPPGDIHVEGELLRLGRRMAVCDMRIWTEAPDRLAAQASVTYAIPS